MNINIRNMALEHNAGRLGTTTVKNFEKQVIPKFVNLLSDFSEEVITVSHVFILGKIYEDKGVLILKAIGMNEEGSLMPYDFIYAPEDRSVAIPANVEYINEETVEEMVRDAFEYVISGLGKIKTQIDVIYFDITKKLERGYHSAGVREDDSTTVYLVGDVDNSMLESNNESKRFEEFCNVN